MRVVIFIFLFVLVCGDLSTEPAFSYNDIERMVNVSNQINAQVVNPQVYQPATFDRDTRYHFWRNYGIRFAIGAAVSIGVSLIVVVARLYKDSKKDTYTHRLVNQRDVEV